MTSRGRGILVGVGVVVLLGVMGWCASVRAQSAADQGKQAEPAPTNAAVSASGTVGGVVAVADFETRERELKGKLAANPQDVETAYALGNLYYDQGKRQEAEDAYNRALKIKSDYVPALVNLGVVLNESGKSTEALVQYDKALAIKPDDVIALCNKGQALYALKRFAEAVGLYEKAITIDPKSQMAHYWLGVSFADASIYKEAITEWQKVVDIDPQSDTAGMAKDGISVIQKLLDEGQ
jgi:tetratricopeptide (TPR) repeat protein